MTPRTRRIFHLANASVCAGALVYTAVKWMVPKPPSEFGTPVHPWEPGLKSAHLLMAPILVFAIGWIWRAHVTSKLRHRGAEKRPSGLMLVALAFPMILSGSFFQISVEQTHRDLWSQIHLWSGALWIVGSIIHGVFSPRRP